MCESANSNLAVCRSPSANRSSRAGCANRWRLRWRLQRIRLPVEIVVEGVSVGWKSHVSALARGLPRHHLRRKTLPDMRASSSGMSSGRNCIAAHDRHAVFSRPLIPFEHLRRCFPKPF